MNLLKGFYEDTWGRQRLSRIVWMSCTWSVQRRQDMCRCADLDSCRLSEPDAWIKEDEQSVFEVFLIVLLER